jgi:RNA polymerase sigma factor (sigma-70 family)
MTPLLIHRQKSVDRAFERLYKRHVHDVYRYTLAVLHNEADAEDITQATFLNAYRAFRKGERPVKPHNWLIKIAHNECRQRFRASARRPQEVGLQETDGHALGGADEDAPTAEELRHALAQLSFNQRAALVMRELEGRSYAEIATILESSVSAVETLLFRARRALREQLEGSLTCGQAELTLSRRLEGSITQTERGALRAHLRECKECASLERRQRAHRTALKKSLGAVPLPASLQSFFGGGSAATVGSGAALAGSGLAGKVVAVVAAGAVVVGGSQAVQAVTTKPDTRNGTLALADSPDSAKTFSSLARVERAAPASRRKSQRAQARTTAFEPAGKGAAHRRSLRRSDLEGSDETAAATASPEPTPASPGVPPAPAPLPQPPAVEPAPLGQLPVRLPPPPVIELPKLPLLPPPPPPPPPVELPKLPLLPPPPPVPLPPLPPLPPPPPPPPLPIPK